MKNVIEHLIRLQTLLKLFEYSTESIQVHNECKDFNKKLTPIIDDLVKIAQTNSKERFNFVIGEVITLKEDTLSDILVKSKQYVEEHREGLDTISINQYLHNITKFIYNIKYLK